MSLHPCVKGGSFWCSNILKQTQTQTSLNEWNLPSLMTLVAESQNYLIFYRSLQGNSPSALVPWRKVRAQRPHAEQKAWSVEGLQSTRQRNPSQDLRLKKSHPEFKISHQGKPKNRNVLCTESLKNVMKWCCSSEKENPDNKYKHDLKALLHWTNSTMQQVARLSSRGIRATKKKTKKNLFMLQKCHDFRRLAHFLLSKLSHSTHLI